MKILFVGSTKRGFMTLQALIAGGADVCGILSLAQDSHERDRYESRIKDLATERRIPIRETKFVRSADYGRWATEELGAESAMCVGVRILLPEDFYATFPRGCWGVHDSLLPDYRGFAPLNWAIINDEPKTGVSLFRISERMDGGEILLQREVPIGPSHTAPEVYLGVCEATVAVVLAGYRLLADGHESPRSQDYATGSFTCARTPDDGCIDWTRSSRQIYNLVRALTFPYPGAYTHYRGQRLIVVSAEEVPNPPVYRGRIPGRVIRFVPSQGAEVLTGDGILRLISVSTDGHTIMPAGDVIRSVKTGLGLTVSDLEQRVLELERRLEAMTIHAQD